MTLYHGISLILLSGLVLIVGMIKPKWILFWMEKPTRMIIAAVAMVMFMIGAVLFGEGNQQKKREQEKQLQAVQPVNPEAEKPAPTAPPPSAVPAQAPATSANELRP